MIMMILAWLETACQLYQQSKEWLLHTLTLMYAIWCKVCVYWILYTHIYSTMKCYKWRTAEQCTSGHHLHCALKHRLDEEKASEYLQVVSDSLITLHSPNSERERPYYLNNNFCVYNVSLSCPGKIVRLTSKLDYTLSDRETCQDYLWFSTSSNGHPQRICGNEIIDFSDSLHTQSFTAILWSNSDQSEGKFEIEARCTDLSIPTVDPESSGDIPLSTTDDN